MKKLLCLILVSFTVIFCGCTAADNSMYLRVHIRADSNSAEAQAVKYEVKDGLSAYLTPVLAVCKSKEEAVAAVKARLGAVTALCDRILRSKGFSYGSRAQLKSELFPVRSYGEYVFDEGVYDALIIELGEGGGDNWWCMVYPPLCFTGGEDNGSGNIVYKSKILEIIEEFKQKYLS